MADFEASASALRTLLETQFSALPLYWPNDPRDPVATGGADGWVYSEIRLVDEGAVSLGGAGARVHRDTGECVIVVYVPRGTLAGTAEAHVAALRRIFRLDALAADGVQIERRTIGLGEVVDGPAGRWWAVPLIIEWWSDRIE